VTAGADVVSVSDNAVPHCEIGRRTGGHRPHDVDTGNQRVLPRDPTLRGDGEGVLVVDSGVFDRDLDVTVGQERLLDDFVDEGDLPFFVLAGDQGIDCRHAAHCSPHAKAPALAYGDLCAGACQPRYEIRSGFIA
jgi:hypothetical protein